MTRKAKILLYDIEVSRETVEGYRNKYDFNVVRTIKHQELMCFAYKWLGEKKIEYVSRHQFKKYSDFVKKLWDILDQADIAIAHNANRFDNKMANRFFVKEGLPPVSPYKSVDTLTVARGMFKFSSNRLNDICEYLGIGNKEKITYADIETDFLNNPTPKIERLMKKYNVQDVKLLEQLYLTLRPYIKNHPNIGDIEESDGVCPKCGSHKLQKRGYNYRRAGKVQRYQCTDCGGWSSQASIKKEGKVVNI